MNPADESLKARLAALGVPLSDEVINLALTHRSFAYESGGIPTNERLEFLGDSVIGLVITEELYKRFPEMDESGLSPLRSGVVSTRALSQVARSLGIGREVRIGRGEEVTGGREKNSILADSLEALIGAIYLEHGLEKAEHAIITLMQEAIEEAISRGATLDGKTSLQELVAARGEGSPEYEISESGPDHAKEFQATAIVAGERVSAGRGKSKREAEQEAARLAYQILLERG
ncbi:MAG: ribonuclease III [Actinobacteria bacterium]|jgi:ribonuclease III|nr:ribonuclease III [Actinomycetota bacterium]NDB07709.1 ribonuclease III [Actinomycetota bacterium]